METGRQSQLFIELHNITPSSSLFSPSLARSLARSSTDTQRPAQEVRVKPAGPLPADPDKDGSGGAGTLQVGSPGTLW